MTKLTQAKIRAFAENKSNVAKIIIFACEWVENIVENVENAPYQYFLLLQQFFEILPCKAC